MTKIKKVGSPRSRRLVKAAPVLGLGVNDIRNLRQSNSLLSVPMLLKLVRRGYTPSSILVGPELEAFNKATKSTRGVQQRLVNRRIAKLAWLRPGAETARITGLSPTGAFGLRYQPDANVKLGTILGFWHAGHDLDAMIFGG